MLALAVGEAFLVSGSYDTTVRFWALDSLRCIRRAPSATFSNLQRQSMSQVSFRLCHMPADRPVSCTSMPAKVTGALMACARQLAALDKLLSNPIAHSRRWKVV